MVCRAVEEKRILNGMWEGLCCCCVGVLGCTPATLPKTAPS